MLERKGWPEAEEELATQMWGPGRRCAPLRLTRTLPAAGIPAGAGVGRPGLLDKDNLTSWLAENLSRGSSEEFLLKVAGSLGVAYWLQWRLGPAVCDSPLELAHCCPHSRSAVTRCVG